jgi:hypothetical protein
LNQGGKDQDLDPETTSLPKETTATQGTTKAPDIMNPEVEVEIDTISQIVGIVPPQEKSRRQDLMHQIEEHPQ